MSKHTPGPWRAIGSEVYEDREGGDFLCEIDQRTLGRRVLVESEANARLIAAAPELLEIARRVAARETFEAHGDVCKTDPCLACVAKVAIAKAEGRHG